MNRLPFRALAVLRSVVLTGLLCLLVAAPSSAEWRRLDSPNFVVIGDVSERALRDIAVKFEGFRETLSRVLTEQATATAVPTVVIVFPSDKAFTPFKPLYEGKPIAMAGLFVRRQNVNYIAMVSDGKADALRVIFHEYAHLVISNIERNIPVWLNEGLAEFYSTFELSQGGREALLGLVIAPHLDLLNHTAHLSLDELLTVGRDSPLYNEGARRSVFYAQSWALTHLILLGQPSRTSELSAYITRLRQGASGPQAWEAAFGAAHMDRALQDYVGQQVFKASRFKFPEKTATFAATPEKLAQPDVEAFLADFLIQQRRLDEAAPRLASAFKLDAANQRVGVAMAGLEIARQEYASAERRLLTLGQASDWLVAYYAGIALGDLVEEQPNDPLKAELLLATRLHLESVRRDHRDAPNVLARLAALELSGSTVPSPEARAFIERARSLVPGRDDYVLVHAQVLMRQGEFAAARGALGPLMTDVYPVSVRDSARRLMGYIVDLETRSRRSNGGSAAAAGASSRPNAPVAATPGERRPDAPQPRPRTTIPVFRTLLAGEQRVEGTLERIVCAAGGAATFHLRTPDGPRQVATNRMSGVDFIAYRDDLTGGVSCGPLKEPMRVYVTWREGTGPGDATIVVAVEFLPKEP